MYDAEAAERIQEKKIQEEKRSLRKPRNAQPNCTAGKQWHDLFKFND